MSAFSFGGFGRLLYSDKSDVCTGVQFKATKNGEENGDKNVHRLLPLFISFIFALSFFFQFFFYCITYFLLSTILSIGGKKCRSPWLGTLPEPGIEPGTFRSSV